MFSFSSFCSIIDLYLLIPNVISKIFNLITKLLIPIEIPSKETKTEIETHAVTAEAKIRKYSI